MGASNPEILAAVLALLRQEAVPFEHLRHAEASSTEALAAARGLPIRCGVKALVMKIRGELTVVALRADQAMDNRMVRRSLRSQKLRFARREELEALGLRPGQVPPLGRPVLPLRLVADEGVLAGERVAFTAGTWTDSLVLETEDWVRVASPEIAQLTTAE